ncbi:hypothetical protein PLESTB_000548900 [Pleodorina starrii]|uniref:Dynein axonemal assembly factor 4 n=1 Tax=Pleodorina starrii TaxID=330485 RepID=A0A9W6BGH9_9CHLO|nr:hypothetical protein PLESTB_000548900 [Pleodorina starrii]GLC69505.1 hypothetical protein PLESTF_000839500 [Pleodorina starrii]
MPLTPQFTWSETDASLEVTVDVPGVSRAKADVFATDAFLKVNCPPYLFALDLHKEVDDSRSSATIVPGGVVFKLFKREPGLWGRLAASGDKADLTRRRNASIDRAYREVEEARKARIARKQQEDKSATQRSMDLDRRKRQEVDRRKAEELAEERGRLEQWQRGLGQGDGGDAESDYEDEEEEEGAEGRQGGAAATRGSVDPEEAPVPDHPDYHGRGWRPSKTAAAAAAEASGRRSGGRGKGSDSGDDEDAGGKGSGSDGDREDGEGGSMAAANGGPRAAAAPSRAAAAGVSFKPLPPPRARLEPVQVSFTKLETGHLPARQQREEEIRAFRKESRAAAAADPDAVDVAERQPLFLKDKGDELFRAGNYSGALNAYSRAIQLDDCHAAVRANRAACRLALGQADGCVEDCDRAMEMLAEQRDRLDHDLLEAAEAAALRRQLVRLLVRRAQARVALAGRGAGGGGGTGGGEEQLAAALRDYEEAMRLSPSDPSLESDYGELLAALKPADAAALRQRGDARFRSGDYEGAAEAFSALLGLPRSRVPESERLAAFSNRAACNLVLERYGAAVADCDAGLALLLPQGSGPGAGDGGATTATADFGAAAGEAGLARLSAWAQSLQLPKDDGAADGTAAPSRGAGLAPAAAAAAAARLLTRRGAAAAHQQRFAAAASDQQLAAELLGRLGEGERAAAATADAERMRALAEGREQLPPRPQPQLLPAQPQPEQQQQPEQQRQPEAQAQQPPGDALREAGVSAPMEQPSPPLAMESAAAPTCGAADAVEESGWGSGSGDAAQGGSQGERRCGGQAASRSSGGGGGKPQQEPPAVRRDATAEADAGRSGRVDADIGGGGGGGSSGDSGTPGSAEGVGARSTSAAATVEGAGTLGIERVGGEEGCGDGDASLLDEVDD